MIKRVLIVMILVLVVARFYQKPKDLQHIEDFSVAVPDFSLKTIDGGTLSKEELKDGSIIVFFATWCPYCKKQSDVFNAASGLPPMYGISIDTDMDKLAQWVKENPMPYFEKIALSDAKIEEVFQADGVPTSFYYKNGAVIKRINGAISQVSLRELLASVKQAQSGVEIKVDAKK